MNALKEKQLDVAASLWITPATIAELSKRLDVSEWGMDRLITIMHDKGWIYFKGETIYTYKKTVKNILNPNGYELDLKEQYKSEFRKEFERLYG